MTPLALDTPDFTRRYLNLADPRLGAEALSVSDDFFAPKERLLNPEPAVFIPGKYDEHGKWMDGWETRRKRVTGHDWCIIRLGRTGVIKGVDLDTSRNACDRGALYDLAAMENGGYVVTANNQHFGAAANMLMPGQGVHMGDGWETRRRREPGNDWCIIALGHLGIRSEE